VDAELHDHVDAEQGHENRHDRVTRISQNHVPEPRSER
jgi:hypothetical protein